MTPLDAAGYVGTVVPPEPAALDRLLLDAIPGGVLQLAFDGSIVVANAEAIRSFHLEFNDATQRWASRPPGDYFFEDGTPCPLRELPPFHVLATGEVQPPITLERRVQGTTETLWAVYRSIPVRDADGAVSGAIVTFLDITERKRAEEELRQSEARWRSLASNVPDFIVLVDRERRILSVNHLMPDMPPERVIGRTNHEFIHPEFRDEWAAQFASVLANRTTTRFETRGRGPQGTEAWYETILVPVDAEESKPVARVLIVARDITARRDMLRNLAEKERLASVGMLSASVAHEIMNPLTYVMANLDFALSDRCAPGARMTKALLDAREGAARMQQIARDLRSLGRAGAEELFYVDVRAIVETALRLAGPEISRNVEVHLAEIPGVLASESRLCQVFINLLVNAAQAMTDRPEAERKIRVTMRLDEARGLVGIDVADTGPGIDPAHLRRIFDPFFTTKRTGTGLGLSITRDALEQMGGSIEVTSSLGHGTTFTVWLSTRRPPPKRTVPPVP